MSLWLKRSILATVAVLVLIQIIRPARTNPAIDPAREIQANLTVDPAVMTALIRSCNDCHSNRTIWPWYSHVAPASWLVAWDVKQGRKALNFSEWSTYAAAAQRDHLSEICKQVTKGEMPEFQYVLMHRGTKLSPSDIAAVCRWTQSSTQRLSAAWGEMRTSPSE